MGYFFAIAASICWGVVYLIDQKVLTTMSPIVMMFLSSVLMLFLTVPLLFLEHKPFKIIAEAGKENFMWLILSIVVATIANYCVFSSIKVLGASTASILEITYPLFIVAFGYLVFRNNVHPAFLLGATLIFLGSAVIIKFH